MRAKSKVLLLVILIGAGCLLAAATSAEKPALPDVQVQDPQNRIPRDTPQMGYIVSNWFSDETGAAECPFGYAVKGLECSGDHCDNMRLWCAGLTPLTYTVNANKMTRTSGWFSEESYSNRRDVFANYHMLDGGAIRHDPVVAIACRGSDCDDIQLTFHPLFNLSYEGVGWPTPFFSEEFQNTKGVPNLYVCPGIHSYVVGLACQGSRCDNISLYCTELR
jgi:hypothetical protein